MEKFDEQIDALLGDAPRAPTPKQKEPESKSFDEQLDALLGTPEKVKGDEQPAEPKPKQSLTSLMRKQNDTVLDNSTYAAGAALRSRFEERGKKSSLLDTQYYSKRDKLDESDNKLLDVLSNISDKYNIERGDLVGYALADGWIPKGEGGTSKLITSTASDVIANVDTAVERDLQDQSFDPVAVQAIAEVRRAVQDSFGLGRMATQMAGEFVGSVVPMIVSGGAAAPAVGAKLAASGAKIAAKAIGKSALSAGVQSGISGGMQGYAFRDNETAITDEKFEADKRAKEIASDEARSGFSPIRRGNEVLRATSDYIGKLYADKVASSPTYQQLKTEYPKSTSFVEGAVPATVLGGAFGGAIGSLPMVAKGVRNAVSKETRTHPRIVEAVAREIAVAKSVDELSPTAKEFVARALPGETPTIEEVQQKVFKTQPLPIEVAQDIARVTSAKELTPESKAYLTKVYGNAKKGYRILVQPIRKMAEFETEIVTTAMPTEFANRNGPLAQDGLEILLNSVRANADGTMSPQARKIRDLISDMDRTFNHGLDAFGSAHRLELHRLADQAGQKNPETGVVNNPEVERVLRGLANKDASFLNDYDAVIRALGGTDDSSKLAADRSPVIRAFQTNLADRSYNNYFELRLLDIMKAQHLSLKTAEDVSRYISGDFDGNPSALLLQLNDAINFARESGNAVDVKATLANKETLSPTDVIDSIDTFKDRVVENEFDKAYNNREVLSVNRELKDAQSAVKKATKDIKQLENEQAKLRAQYATKAEDITKRLDTINMDNTADEMAIIKEEIAAALASEDRIPADIIKYIEQDIAKSKGPANDVRALANAVKAYNETFVKREAADVAYLDAQDNLVQLNNNLDQYPELRTAGYSEVQKLVNYFTRIMTEKGEKVDSLVGKLKEQTDFLVFGADKVQRDLLSDLFTNTNYGVLISRMEDALIAETPIDPSIITGLREFTKLLRENDVMRDMLAKVVRSTDKIERIADNIDNVADSLVMLERDKEYFVNLSQDLAHKAADEKGMAATRLAIINRSLKLMGHNRKTVIELEKLKATLQPILEARMNGAGLSSYHKRQISRFLESDTFERIRLMASDPDWAIYAEETVDALLSVMNQVGPQFREIFANIYMQAKGKPLPEHTFYAFVLTPKNQYTGTDLRVKEAFDIAARNKKTPNNISLREYGNSDIVNSIITLNTGLPTYTATSAVHADLRMAQRIANELAVEQVERLDKLRAFNGTRYRNHHNRQEFVQAWYRIYGVGGSDLKQFPFFSAVDDKTKTVSKSPMYKVLEELVETQKDMRHIDLSSADLETIVAKHFEDPAAAVDYIRRYFGVTELSLLEPATLDIALKSAYEGKLFDLHRINVLNKAQEGINASRNVNYPPIDYRSDHVQYTLLTAEDPNVDPVQMLQNIGYNFISSSRDGQTSKATGVEIIHLAHPDMAMMNQTHGLARKILMRDSVSRLKQVGILSDSMGYKQDVISVNNLLAGQTSVAGDVRGVSRLIDNIEGVIVRRGGRLTFEAYQAFKGTVNLLAGVALSRPLGQVINLAQATTFGIEVGFKKNPRALANATSFPIRVAGNIVHSIGKDVHSGVGKLAKYTAEKATHHYRNTFPWKIAVRSVSEEAGEHAQRVGDTDLLNTNPDVLILDHMNLDTTAIVNKVISEVIEADNLMQFKFRRQEAINAGVITTMDKVIRDLPRWIASYTGWVTKRADFVSTQIKERVETAMLRTNFNNAARVYTTIIDDVVDRVAAGNLGDDVQAISNAFVESYNKYSLLAGESQAEIRSFANRIANEFVKAPDKRNYNVALRDFLLYSNDMMQGRFGSASNPIAINNMARSFPGLNQFFPSITAGAMRFVKLASQGKGVLVERDFAMARALGGAVTASAMIALIEFGPGRRVADGYADLVEMEEGRREASLSSKVIDRLLAGDVDGLTYKLLAEGTGIGLWSLTGSIGSLVGGAARGYEHSREKSLAAGVVAGLGHLPRMGGLQFGIGVELAVYLINIAQFIHKEKNGAQWEGKDIDEKIKNRAIEQERLMGRGSSYALEFLIPSRDIVNNPLLAYTLMTNDEERNALIFGMINDKGGTFAGQGAMEKMMHAAGVKNERYLKAMSGLNELMNLYNYANLGKFSEQYKKHERENLSFLGERERKIIRDNMENDMRIQIERDKLDGGFLNRESRNRITRERIIRENGTEASERGLREITK